MLIDQLWREMRPAIRRLLATPVFTIFAVVSLALGLGVSTAVYAAIDALFWPTSSIDDPNHLVVMTHRQDPGASVSWRDPISRDISRNDFANLRSRVRSVPELAASSFASGVLNDGTRASAFVVEAVTGNYFTTVRLPLHLGRGIQPSDDRAGADPVVVLTYAFWQARAGGDPGIVGRTVRIADRPFVVVGVAAESVKRVPDINGFAHFVLGDGWIPLEDKSIVNGAVETSRDTPELAVVARLAPGVDVQAVSTEISGIGEALDRSAPIIRDESNPPVSDPRSWSATTLAAARDVSAGTARDAGVALVLLVALVLVVACTNIANLTLGRGASRAHEFAVRRALGASRGRLIREQCGESVVLATLGGLGAFLVVKTLLWRFTTQLPTGIRLQEISLQPRLDAPTLFAAAGSLLVSLVVFGLIPALQLTRVSLRSRIAGDASGTSPNRWSGRRCLIALQVAISTAFLLTAFASMRAVMVDARHDPGFDLQHLAVGMVSLEPLNGDAARRQHAIDQLAEAARAEAGFESVAVTGGLPIGVGVFRSFQVSTLDQPLARHTVIGMASTSGIFRTMGVPILRGRGLDDRDTAATRPVMVVSEHVARELFGTSDVLGRQLILETPTSDPKAVDIIGIARDTDTWQFLDRRVGAVYAPLVQQDARSVFIVGRTGGDPAETLPLFEKIVRAADPNLAVQHVSTATRGIAPQYLFLRTAAQLSGGLSMLAVALGMLGLYGVLSHLVARRTREIGLRLALGAEPGRVRQMIVGEGLRPVLWGLGIGLFVGIGARIVLRTSLAFTDVSAIDPPAFTVAAITLISAGLVACYFPARRASQVDPNVALRDL